VVAEPNRIVSLRKWLAQFAVVIALLSTFLTFLV